MDEVLDERKRKILKAIIKTYMETGEPVGSRTISKYPDLNVSSATIRNEMSDLTDMGYIVQPHTWIVSPGFLTQPPIPAEASMPITSFTFFWIS